MALIQRIREVARLDSKPSTAAVKLPEKWPPTDQQGRFSRYETYQAIWQGAHALALDEQDIAGRYGQYIAVNLPRIIVTIPADFLFGEEFELDYPEGTSEERIKEIDAIRERNNDNLLFYESALDGGVDGDSILVVERDAEGLAGFKAIPAKNWFPELNPDDIRDVVAHWIGWKRIVVVANKEREFLRLIKHEKGRILNFVVEIDKGGKLSPDSEDGWAALYPDASTRPPKTIDTGIDGFALEHIPNWRTAKEYFGRGEYLDLQPMFASLNARITQGDQVLHRNTDPTLAMPKDVYAALRNARSATDPRTRSATAVSTIDKAALDVVAMGDNGETPAYVTWDGRIEDNLALTDKLVNLIALVSETAPQLLNQGEWGGDMSGRALKIMLLRTLAKVNRRRKYYSVAIPNLIVKAQEVEGLADPVRPTVKWPDGLPQDVREAVEIAEMKLRAGLSTVKREIMQVEDVDEKTAEKIVQEIEGDKDAEEERMVDTFNKTKAKMAGPGGRAPINVAVGT